MNKAMGLGLVIISVVWLSGCSSGTGTPLGSGDSYDHNTALDGADPELPGWNGGGNQLATAQLGLYSLSRAADCEDAGRIWRDHQIRKMEEILKANLLNLLNPGDCWDGYSCDSMAGYEEEPGEERASEYTTTNNQEVDVNEADFIMNDGSHIFILTEDSFQIMDAWPAEQAHRISLTPIPGEPRRMFVRGDFAVIFSRMNYHQDYYYDYACSSYGYNCEYTGDGGDTLVTVLDISNPEAPIKLRTMEMDGSYVGARMIEGIVYLVVYFDPPSQNSISYPTWPTSLQQYAGICAGDPLPPYSEAEITAMFEELRLANVELIRQMEFSAYLPEMKDEFYQDGATLGLPSPMDQCGNYYSAQTGDGESIISLLSFKPGEGQPLQATNIIASPGVLYGSKQALYLAHSHSRSQALPWFEELGDNNEATTIHKFLLANDSPATTYAASGLVKGRILNQFAMSEYEDHLRVATTTGHIPYSSHNTMSVLGMNEGRLEVTGQLDNLAPDEDIRSVRFSGPTGFMVTFKKTDPLFTFDLSDPADPKVLGELKIPGFSTYMHFMDPEHLLTIGYDASDQGSFAWFTGIMLQVFDVTDLVNPGLMYKEVIGTRGSTSDAATDHLAFTWFGARDLLAIPMTVCEEGNENGGYGDNVSFSGLMIYRVTLDGGFEYLGGVPHATPDGGQVSCDNWWTNSNSLVKRSIFMEDWVYSVSRSEINIANIEDPSEVVVSIDL